jgi:hypothetical protein
MKLLLYIKAIFQLSLLISILILGLHIFKSGSLSIENYERLVIVFGIQISFLLIIRLIIKRIKDGKPS